LLSKKTLAFSKHDYPFFSITENLVFGQGKISEQQYFANQYKMACLRATTAWFLWSLWIFNDKWDSVSFLVKSGNPPMVSFRIYFLHKKSENYYKKHYCTELNISLSNKKSYREQNSERKIIIKKRNKT
jgi:hypothetical protein